MSELKFEVVNEVPAVEKTPRPSRWDKAFKALPEAGEGSLQIECESAPVARNVAATARQYARARKIGVRVSRRGAQVFLTRKPKA